MLLSMLRARVVQISQTSHWERRSLQGPTVYFSAYVFKDTPPSPQKVQTLPPFLDSDVFGVLEEVSSHLWVCIHVLCVKREHIVSFLWERLACPVRLEASLLKREEVDAWSAQLEPTPMSVAVHIVGDVHWVTPQALLAPPIALYNVLGWQMHDHLRKRIVRLPT